MSKDYQNIGLDVIDMAVANGDLLFNSKTKSQDFNRACDHILVLLLDAVSCFERCSYGTAVFLSITVIEEVAKASIGLFRRANNTQPAKGRTDKLFSHVAKHQMAILPTVFMGKRLEDAIGKERCQQLLEEAADGKFSKLREDSLYFRSEHNQFATPGESITRQKAREMILLAIETADDRLVGYTGHTGLIEKRMDALFEAVANL
ncbi:AbiV family abortive infection protein [Methylomonas rosea]|uniref:AbiV family abortive infection protein n=1 Tax=Methylomonas rosea TaxID=2952227 RepID=A0ABT1TYR5_9GAMM|nr:AbiV family abortive infection protein [Methylomonas sp. WSC-7]MCQ8119914.1 AbiV family abortive infection protein [Methylomonas sp. WSC-7]